MVLKLLPDKAKSRGGQRREGKREKERERGREGEGEKGKVSDRSNTINMERESTRN